MCYEDYMIKNTEKAELSSYVIPKLPTGWANFSALNFPNLARESFTEQLSPCVSHGEGLRVEDICRASPKTDNE